MFTRAENGRRGTVWSGCSMKPEILPMQRLHQFRHWKWLSGNVLMPGAAHAQHPLEFVRENLDETRQHVHPVIENVLGALASSQFEMAFDQSVNQVHIAR